MVALQGSAGPPGDPYLGLLRYRGQVVPTFALCPADGAAQEHPDWMLVVLRDARGPGAIVVRDVLGPMTVPAARLLRPRGATELVEIDADLVPVLRRAIP